MKTNHLLALVFAAAAAPALAASELPYFGLQGTYLSPDQDRLTADGMGATLLLGKPLGSYLAGELNLSALKGNLKAGTGSSQQLGAGLDLAFFPLQRSSELSPFLLLGVGAQYDDRPGDSGSHLLANLGGGLLYGLNERLSLRLDAKRTMVSDNDIAPGNKRLWDSRVSAGVQMALGWKPTVIATTEPERAPAAPPPPPRDSDGDGVADYADRCPGTRPGLVVDGTGCPPPPPPMPPKDSDQDGVLDPADACPGTPYGMQIDTAGCAIRTAKVVLHDISFEFNSAVLTAAARQSLARVADGLRGQPSMELVIEGHTDSVGADAYNLKLSQQRANAARKYLIEEGISATRLSARGAGESKPIASNKTKDGRALNRRVEFSVSRQ